MSQVAKLGAAPRQSMGQRMGKTLRIKPRLFWPLFLTAALVLIALLAPVLATYDPNQQDLLNSLAPPSAEHWLGTDGQGRDIYSRLLFGLRLDLFGALGAVLLGFVFGTPLGVITGLLGGLFERVAMRFVDAALAIPPILLIMSVIAVLGRDYIHSMIALAVIFSFGYIRIGRGEAKMIRQSTHVYAARAIGVSGWRLIYRHVLPSALPALIMQIGLFMPVALLVSASLSYLGLGVQSPQSSLGSMLQAAQEVSLNAPWQVLPPGLLLAVAALILSFLAEAFSDSMNPRGDAESLLVTASGRLRKQRKPRKTDAEYVLEVNGLSVEVNDPQMGPRMAVRDVSFSIRRGAVLAVVGESGSGKTLSAMSIAGLGPGGTRVASGSVRVAGREVAGASRDVLREVRADEVAVIFQNPLTSLSPAHTIGTQLIRPLMKLKGISRAQARRRVIDLFNEVGIPEPERRLEQYPHELSGGLAQRVIIAQALSREPLLLVADEATSALDVTVQYQVLELLRRLGKERGLSILFVTHSMGVVSHIADEVVVMYAGEVVESGPAKQVVTQPAHPYTIALLNAVPRNVAGKHLPKAPPGAAPRGSADLQGCVFAPRCPLADSDCRAQSIALLETDEQHLVRCLRSANETIALKEG